MFFQSFSISNRENRLKKLLPRSILNAYNPKSERAFGLNGKPFNQQTNPRKPNK